MVPWFLKIPLKVALSRMPLSRSVLNRVGVFRHGDMARANYALNVVLKHLKATNLELNGKTLLELGPGDSVGNGIVAFALGASRSILVDQGAWAVHTPATYRKFVKTLDGALPDPSRLRNAGTDWGTFGELLDAYHISYLTQGVHSLHEIPSHSVDMCFSHAVLEHIRLQDFAETIAETHRVLRRDGLASHIIDYQDHLQAGLNNLRFSRELWESELFASSGFYTNRLRHGAVKDVFRSAGFQLTAETVQRWAAVPIRTSSIHPELRNCSTDDLLIFAASIVVRAVAAENGK